MLVITRKPGEGFVIGDDITVRILEEKDGRIRIGIDAPQDKRIYREEVYVRIQAENKEASQWSVADMTDLSRRLGKSTEELPE